ncbi:MAG: amylo-alpha-1,6-glucosidase, partial [Dehalococcoidia bacterium]
TGPLNLLNINPRGRYYSDYASPADFLIMLGQHLMWTGDRDFFRAHLPAIERVLAWFDNDADLDGDGFYEYQTRSPQGDRNQGWKDSERAIPHADGRDAPLPVAASDLQAYVYAGKQQLGVGLIAVGRLRDGLRLLREAADLKRRFNAAFWMPEEGFLALALDGDKRQVRSIASNAGHCLAAGIVDAARAPAVAGRLMAPDMFSGWGVRTLSAQHAAYNPFSYHLGSLWTVEQATIAFGLKRYGFGEHANAIARGTFDLAERYALHRLPEAVGGLPRDRQHPFPGLYPRSCWPQAWSASAVIMLLQVMLGLRPIAPLGLLLVYPELPDWLPDLTLRDLRVGSSTLTIQFRRGRDGATDYRILERRGPVRVLREPPESSVRHGLARRALDPLVAALTGHI